MTFQDFLAASQGDERLAMARPDPTTATRTRCGYAASPAQWRNGTITGVFDVPPKKRGRMGLCVGSEWDSETGALILCGLTLPRDESDTEPHPYDLVLE